MSLQKCLYFDTLYIRALELLFENIKKHTFTNEFKYHLSSRKVSSDCHVTIDIHINKTHLLKNREKEKLRSRYKCNHYCGHL